MGRSILHRSSLRGDERWLLAPRLLKPCFETFEAQLCVDGDVEADDIGSEPATFSFKMRIYL